MIILNKSKAVKVLKAIGLAPLRLFPGHNTVDEKVVPEYFKNAAAKGVQKECLSVVEGDLLSHEEKTQADKAKKKNDELNRAQKIIKASNEKLVKNDETISGQKSTIETQGEQLAEQKSIIEKMSEQMEQMAAKIEKFSKPKAKK